MATNSPSGQIYATLLLTDSYLPGALVLAHSLRDAGAKRNLVLFFTADTVSQSSLSQAQVVYDYIIPVPRIQTGSQDGLYAMNRPDLHSTYTKINLWSQTNFSKIVYIDSDVVAYRAPDELFDITQPFSAAPDIGWPDIFNSGVMVLTPNLGDYYALLAMAERGISFDGADQGLLNLYFKNTFNRISFTYNVTPSGHYQYVPAYRHFQSTISMVHFIGQNKPWFQNRHHQSAQSLPYAEMVGRWWAVYDRHYREQEESSILLGSSGRDTAQSDANSKHQHVSQHPASQVNANQPEIIQPSAISTSLPSIISPPAPGQDASVPLPTQEPAEEPAWDAQRQSPPTNSKPEAINFPATHYEMSEDATPFVAPNRYPSPPKNMWYEVPTTHPGNTSTAPAAIFPWESKQPEPTRTFPEVEPAADPEPPLPVPEEDPPVAAAAQSPEPSAAVEPVSPWASFRSVNAWDELPEINRYVQARNLGRSPRQKSTPQPPLAQPTPQKISALRLTDFPSENDRPSLPVTPAPVRRASFWDSGDGERSDKPAEALLPNEEATYDWNPKERLQELATQHSDDLLRKLEQAATDAENDIPTRDLPFGSEPPT